MSMNGREPACSVSYKITIIKIYINEIETTDPLLFCLQNPTKFTYIFLLSIYNHELL